MTNLELALTDEVKHPVEVQSMSVKITENKKDTPTVDFNIHCVAIPGFYEEDDEDEDEIPFCDMDCEHCCEGEEIDDYTPPMYGIPDIDKIIFNPPLTTVFWEDGTATTVRCMEGDTFDKYAGFSAACMKKMFGSTGSAKALMDNFEFDIKSLEPKPQKSSFSEKPQISSFDEFLNAISEAFMKALSAKKEKK